MKKTAMLNAPLSHIIASMGHTDSLCVSDAGLPIPAGPERIDLAVTRGIPGFSDLLSAVLEELVVERAVVAAEIAEKSPEILSRIRTLLGAIPVEFVPHEEFKTLTTGCRAVARSGECTPFANVILYSGVPF